MRGRISCFLVLLLTACGGAWNDPYPAADRGRNILYTAFTDRPKHLDPVQSYSEDEITFTAPDLRAAAAVPLPEAALRADPATAEAMPQPRYWTPGTGELPATPMPRPTSPSRSTTSASSRASATSRIRPLPAMRRRVRCTTRLGAAEIAGVNASRLRARHARTDRRRLRLPDQAPGPSAPAFADLRPDERVHRRARRITASAEGGEGSRPGEGAGPAPASLEGVEVIDRHPTASASRASTRSSSTGWRCPSSRRCPGRPTSSTASPAWRRRT
jgi:hypothetical protein